MTDRLEGAGIVIVDDDDEFLDEAKRLFEGRVPTMRTLADAQRSVEAGEVDLVMLGPSFADEDGLAAAAPLVESDPDLTVVLVTETASAPLLRSAMRAGLKDVIEAPLTEQSVMDVIAQTAPRAACPASGAVCGRSRRRQGDHGHVRQGRERKDGYRHQPGNAVGPTA